MNILSIFALGFFIKVVTGIDDVLTRVPVITAITRTRMGKIAFSLGAVTAVTVATGIAFFLSEFLQNLPAYRSIVAGLILILAATIYFNIFVHKPKSKAEQRVVQMEKISRGRFFELFIIGFIASFITILDDVIAFFPIFFAEDHLIPFGIIGILTATVAQAIFVIYASDKIARIPYKEKIAAAGLVLLSIGILFGII